MRKFIIIIIISALGSLAVVPAAAGHWKDIYWSWTMKDHDYQCTSSDGGKRSDPIGMVFYGTYATHPNIHDDITYHARKVRHEDWSHDDEPNPFPFSYTHQMVWDHHMPGCAPNQEANASKGFDFAHVTTQTRYHIRLFELTGFDLKGRSETVGTPHYELPCGNPPFGHGVTSFDKGRREFGRLLEGPQAAHLHKITNDPGESRSAKQCGDPNWVARSNGTILWVDYPDSANTRS
ncbi:MAG: hypothetical protein QOJ29_1843 [Thermoleophilaceae bacterium]|jgi:hypothetical protein|nr:hypothetical protein [Thermoleophilaceae bacterium]